MYLNDIHEGLKVRVVKDERTTGMMIKPEFLARRAIGKTGTVKGFVPGHGGDVWWVEQNDGIAAYCFTELEEIQ